MARVTLLYFAWVRDAIGVGAEDVDLPPDMHTPRDVIAWLECRGDGYRTAFADVQRIRCAVDQSFSPLDAPFDNATEIAFFPPVTGG